ncbi:hypothetical protein WJU23_18905 [Prosthecobacter sp. SYSU 5D2]|uniref:hypothetical protein n=1 Tax=Prosthecobacter sp. SYSU 5D2 TaxID=3134134 RepID=UPI0031FEB9A9
MPAPRPPSGYSNPDLPDADGYSVPDLPAAGSVKTSPSADTGSRSSLSTAQTGVSSPVRDFVMQPLGADYQAGEKNTPAEQVEMDGQTVEVHEKDWLRQQTDARRASENKPAVTDEVWKAHVATTQYMNDSQRADHQVDFLLDVDATGAVNARLDGGGMEAGEEHIFVMDGAGEIYAKEAQAALSQKDETGRGVHVHHSSFLAGEDVAGAGEMKVGQDGFLKEVTDRSGHYKPGEAQTTQTLSELETKGVNLNNVKFTLDRGTEKTGGMAREYQQGGEKVFQDRHNMVDELKETGKSVRDVLNKAANERAARVAQAVRGQEPGEPAASLEADGAKVEKKLEKDFQEALGDQLQEQKDEIKSAKTLRETMAQDSDDGYAVPISGQSMRH